MKAKHFLINAGPTSATRDGPSINIWSDIRSSDIRPAAETFKRFNTKVNRKYLCYRRNPATFLTHNLIFTLNFLKLVTSVLVLND